MPKTWMHRMLSKGFPPNINRKFGWRCSSKTALLQWFLLAVQHLRWAPLFCASWIFGAQKHAASNPSPLFWVIKCDSHMTSFCCLNGDCAGFLPLPIQELPTPSEGCNHRCLDAKKHGVVMLALTHLMLWFDGLLKVVPTHLWIYPPKH